MSSGLQPGSNAQAVTPATDSAPFPVVFGASSGGAPVAGPLTTAGDSVAVPAPGYQFASAKFTVTAAGTATATAQVSLDGGFNWRPAPYAKRLFPVGAAAVQAIVATTLVTGDVWEVPLPGTATHFRLLCAGTGTTTTVILAGGALYVPGVPVTAVLYETTSAVNTALDTGTLDASGWTSLLFLVVYAVSFQQITVSAVDDAGTPLQVGSFTPSASTCWGWGPGMLVPGSAGGGNGQLPLAKRVRAQAIASATGGTTRLRIEAQR